MCARPRIIAYPDAKVLDLQWSLLVDELHKEIPEARFGDDGVRSEDAHAVEFWSWFRLGGKVTTDHLVLREATYYGSISHLFRLSQDDQEP